MEDKPVKIIVVDDNTDLANAIRDYYNNHDQGIEPISTTNPSDIHAILEENPDVKLILTDYYMPEINGINLLKSVHQKYPHIHFILMTGYHSLDIQNDGLTEGAVSYFRKPFSINKLTHVIHKTMDKANTGFGGVIESVQLPDIVQLINTSQRSVALKLNTHDKEGSIFFENGEIIHAETETLSGEEAFYDLFNWVGGNFHTVPLIIDVKKTIKSSTTALIIEAARRQDEAIAWSGNIPDEMLDDEQDAIFDSSENGNEPDFADSKSENEMVFEEEEKQIIQDDSIVNQNLNRNDLNSKINIIEETVVIPDETVDVIHFNGVDPTEPEIDAEEDTTTSQSETAQPEIAELKDEVIYDPQPEIELTPFEPRYAKIIDPNNIADGGHLVEPISTDLPAAETDIEETKLNVEISDEIESERIAESEQDGALINDFKVEPKSVIVHSTLPDDQGYRDQGETAYDEGELSEDEQIGSYSKLDELLSSSDVETEKEEEVESSIDHEEDLIEEGEAKQIETPTSTSGGDDNLEMLTDDSSIDSATPEITNDTVDETIAQDVMESEPDEEKATIIEQFDTPPDFEPDIDASKFETDNIEEVEKDTLILNDRMIGEAIEKAVDYFIEFWPNDENEINASSLPLDTLPEYIQAHFQFRFQQDLTKVVHTENLPFNFDNEEVSASVQNLLSSLFANWKFTQSNYLDILRYAISFELARAIDPARATTEVLHELSDGIASKIKPLIRGMINFGIIGDQYLALIVDISKQGDREINTHTLEYLCRSVLYRLDEEQRWLMFKDAMNRMLEIARFGNEKSVDHVHFNVVLNMLEAHGLAQISDYINMTREMGKMELSVEEAVCYFEKYKARNQSVAFEE
jgi:CheY-like chemotaxis protein